jgi:uncharacterized protein (DUF305 family)
MKSADMMPQMAAGDRRQRRSKSRSAPGTLQSFGMGLAWSACGMVLATTAVAFAGAACHSAQMKTTPRIVQPGAPGEPSRVITEEKAVDLSQVQYTEADVRFMQGMIGHHAQALEMTALLPSRTASNDMRKLAQRIEVSQADEIKMMQHWLEARGQRQPDPHAHHAGGAALMPGMLTPEEMARLAEARGSAFDRLFLQFMIKHHEGALIMVKDLFATPGAGQETEIFTFASDVDADQRMEIERMGAMLAMLEEPKK